MTNNKKLFLVSTQKGYELFCSNKGIEKVVELTPSDLEHIIFLVKNSLTDIELQGDTEFIDDEKAILKKLEALK